MALFPVLCFLVLCAFLGCLGLFALAVTKVVAPDGRGHARGFAGGCASMLALFLLCSLGLAGLAATVAAIGVGSVSRWNPIRHIEVSRAPRASSDGRARVPQDDARGHDSRGDDLQSDDPQRDDVESDGVEGDGVPSDPEHAVSARFTVRGDAGAELVELLHGLVDVDLDQLGDGLTVRHRTGADGGEFSVYEFRLPISEHELDRFEHDVQNGLDGLKLRLPDKVDIEFDGAR